MLLVGFLVCLSNPTTRMFPARVINGQVIRFDHLTPFKMVFERPARGTLPAHRWEIMVVFDCHVFTEKPEPGAVDAPESLWTDSGGNRRCFCPKRHKASYKLVEMIRGLPGGQTRCYLARKNNYMTFSMTGATGAQVAYQAYFTVSRHIGDTPLLLYVQSAYVKDEPAKAQKQDSTTFGTICAEVLGLIPKRKR